MNKSEFNRLAIKFIDKRRIDRDEMRYSDELYNFTEEQREEFLDYFDSKIDELIDALKNSEES